MKKIYIHENVSYGSTGQKWLFKGTSGFEFRTTFRGGHETAEKVARVVNGCLKRTNGQGLDNLGRANINQITDKLSKPFIFVPTFTAES